MAKQYVLQFGSGDPRPFTGLSPTLVIFMVTSSGQTLTPPAISAIGVSTGLYTFAFGATVSISFLADAATTSPGPAGRYVAGSIDPADRSDEYGNTLVALGNTNVALGTTNVALGTTSVAWGSTNATQAGLNIGIGTTTYAYLQSLGSTLGGINSSLNILIGTTASSFGGASTNPSDLFGYLKRIQEGLEGQETFLKGTGVLTMYDRTGTATFAIRTIANNVSLVIKT